jgi:hypothetical protein
MAVDPHNWDPLSVDALADVFRSIPVPWWIAGGCALDLFLGKQTRRHADTDVLFLRRDQLIVQEHLPDWQLFKTKHPTPPHLAPWPAGEFLDLPISDIWVRRDDGAAWAFQIMLMETEGEEWIYRRLPSIRGNIADLELRTESGIPYLAPEIQLLYKSGSGRRKDRVDLDRVLPQLAPEQVRWLLDCLRMQYPQGHRWIQYIERSSVAQALGGPTRQESDD